jgi:hypothetical protein
VSFNFNGIDHVIFDNKLFEFKYIGSLGRSVPVYSRNRSLISAVDAYIRNGVDMPIDEYLTKMFEC